MPDKTNEMPDDLRRVLEDASITIPRDTDVWALVGKWALTRPLTASAPTYAEVIEERNAALLRASAAEARCSELDERLSEAERALRNMVRLARRLPSLSQDELDQRFAAEHLVALAPGETR